MNIRRKLTAIFLAVALMLSNVTTAMAFPSSPMDAGVSDSLSSRPILVEHIPSLYGAGDTVVISVTSILGDGSYSVGQVVPIQVIFSDTITVSGTPQLTLTTGSPATTVVDYIVGGGPNTLLFNYTVAAGNSSLDLDYAATSSLALNGGSIQDSGLFDVSLALPEPGASGSLGANKDIVIDTTAPSVTFDLQDESDTGTSNSDNLTNTSSLVFDATFSEAITGFTDTDLSNAGSATGCSFSVGTPSGNVYPLTVTSCSENTLILRLQAGSVSDAAGNTTAETDGPTVTINRTGPAVGLDSTASNPTNTSPIPVTVTFTASVADFISTDITPTNATVDNFSGSGASYSFDLVPSGQGTVSADIAAGVAQDAAGNGNTAAITLSRTYDSQAPTVSMSSTAPSPTNTSPILVTVTFSESVTDFISTDISPTNAAVNNFSGSGASYSFDLVPSGQGLVSADIAAGVAQDSAGNLNTAASTFSRTYDSNSPTVTFDLQSGSDSGTSDSDDLTNATSLIIEAAFSKAVTGLTTDDLTNIGSATGCSISVGTPSGNTYPLTLSSCSAGTAIIRLAGSTVTDSAGNPNDQTDGPTITIDRSGPTVAMNSLAADPTNTSPIPVTVTFTEAVTSFASTDIVPTNGTIDNFSGSGASYSFELTPSGQGATTANIDGGVAQDAAGNDNVTATQFSRVYDSQLPTVVFDLQPGSDTGISNTDNITNATSLVYEALVSETVSGFLPADLTNTGTASGCSFSIGEPVGNTFPLTVNSCSAGTVVVRLAENAVNDAAGNQNAQTDAPSVTIDRIAPTLSMSSLAADPTKTSPITVTVTFTETIHGFVTTDIFPTNGQSVISAAQEPVTPSTSPLADRDRSAQTLPQMQPRTLLPMATSSRSLSAAPMMVTLLPSACLPALLIPPIPHPSR